MLKLREIEETCLQCGHRAYPATRSYANLTEAVEIWRREQKVHAAWVQLGA